MSATKTDEVPKSCLECDWTPICKMYESIDTLIEEGLENDINYIDQDALTRLVAVKCIYYTKAKEL